MWCKWLLGHEDIKAEQATLVWDPADTLGSLGKLRVYVENEAAKAIKWYFDSKASKALWSRWLRFLAISLSTIGGLLPIAVTLLKAKYPGFIGQIESGLIVSVLLGVAAGLLAFDHFFGFSSGWIRYVLTATSLQGALEEFRMDWEMLNATAFSQPTSDQIMALVQRAKSFRVAVAGMVLEETKAWAIEFQNNLAQLEKDVKAQLEQQRTKIEEQIKVQTAAAPPGGIEVTVPNALTMDDRSFTVSFETGTSKPPPETVVGAIHWARVAVAPGQYKIVVRAKKSSAEVEASSIVKVESGTVANTEIKLPD
jgi:hypothetical protein